MRLLFNYRRTLQKCGKSPAELLLVNQICSRLDTCFPPALTKPKEDKEDWLPLPGIEVYSRNFGAGNKWIPGNVKATSGARMVTVETSDGVVQQHVDQIRLQQDSPKDQAPFTTGKSCIEPDQARERSHQEEVNPDKGMSARPIPQEAGSAQRASPKVTTGPRNNSVPKKLQYGEILVQVLKCWQNLFICLCKYMVTCMYTL